MENIAGRRTANTDVKAGTWLMCSRNVKEARVPGVLSKQESGRR